MLAGFSATFHVRYITNCSKNKMTLETCPSICNLKFHSNLKARTKGKASKEIYDQELFSKNMLT